MRVINPVDEIGGLASDKPLASLGSNRHCIPRPAHGSYPLSYPLIGGPYPPTIIWLLGSTPPPTDNPDLAQDFPDLVSFRDNVIQIRPMYETDPRALLSREYPDLALLNDNAIQIAPIYQSDLSTTSDVTGSDKSTVNLPYLQCQPRQLHTLILHLRLPAI